MRARTDGEVHARTAEDRERDPHEDADRGRAAASGDRRDDHRDAEECKRAPEGDRHVAPGALHPSNATRRERPVAWPARPPRSPAWDAPRAPSRWSGRTATRRGSGAAA